MKMKNDINTDKRMSYTISDDDHRKLNMLTNMHKMIFHVCKSFFWKSQNLTNIYQTYVLIHTGRNSIFGIVVGCDCIARV
jgi:hypothetical protein